MSLQLESQFKGDTAILFCKGDLVGGDQTAQLRNAVTELLRERNRVILDLRGIQYINSGGLSSLVGLYATARTSGGSLKYVNLAIAIDFGKRQPPSERAA